MPRRNRPRGTGHAGQPPRDLPRDGASYLGTRREDGPSHLPGGESEPYLVRRMGASAAQKYYLCPGCNQNIPPGVPHIVAWPDTLRGADDRRHWHSGCWQRRRRGKR
ncbi:MAG: hypothetical protein ACTH1D_12955 [Mycobacteriaceae bacterium]|uniref:hypothetical protein n=1 Tax=Corynebacterium sp. TaxID=1720 RepID=UPI003F9C5F74